MSKTTKFKTKTVRIPALVCRRCEHTWYPALRVIFAAAGRGVGAEALVSICPACKSRNWRTPRTNRQGMRPKPQAELMVHNYDPFPFTHQGIEWMPQFPVGPTCCDAKQQRQVADALDAARKWNERTGYPVYLGEFGAYEKADMKSRDYEVLRDTGGSIA